MADKIEISRAKRDNSFTEVIYSDGTMATINTKTGKQAGGLLNISNQAKFKDAKAAYDKANPAPTTPVNPPPVTPVEPPPTTSGNPPPTTPNVPVTPPPPTTGGNIPPAVQPAPTTVTPTTPQAPPPNSNVQVTPDVATGADEINAVDISGQLVTDPGLLVNKNAGTQLSGATPAIDPNAGMQGAAPTGNAGALAKNAVDATATNATATNATTTNAEASTAGTTAAGVQGATATTGTSATQGQTATVDAAKTFDQVVQENMNAQQGTVSGNAQVDANGLQIDVDATGKGLNETGKALNDYAKQSISTLIDTSTAAGKLLAQTLGEGNYTDTKTTVKGQLDILAAEFIDPATGQPKIPSWASGVARSVSRIAAFKGMTGTAATAAMSQAILEASMPIATEDAKFFQTINMSNLDKKQEAIINKANVLSKLDIANLDARTTAAVTNAKSFLEMDLANLNNRQQAELVNTQQRFQSILEDAKSENTARMFNAQSQNEMDKYYDGLADAMAQFNASQLNAMAEFNAGEFNDTAQFNAAEANKTAQFNANLKTQTSQFNAAEANETSKFNASNATETSKFNASEANKISALNATEDNAMAKFNAELEDSREKFYKDMQFQVDTANAKWRQTVTLTENAQSFEAAATDVKNRVGISVEQLNRLWDRADSLLDYSWKAAQNEKDRKTQLALVTLKGQIDSDAADQAGWGNIVGTILGGLVGWIF